MTVISAYGPQKVIEVLRQEIKYSPLFEIVDHNGRSSTFREPFFLWVWHWERLRQICSGNDECSHGGRLSSYSDRDVTCYDEVTRKHLKVVLDRLQPFYNERIVPELHLHEERQKVAWQNFWILYKPGSMVVGKTKPLEFYIVFGINYPDEDRPFPRVETWNLAFDGRRLRRRNVFFDFEEWNGEMDIQSLVIRPIKYVKISNTEKEDLISRGKKYYKIICEAPTQFGYRGFIGGSDRVQYAGPVFVDPSKNSTESRETLGTEYYVDQSNMFIGDEPLGNGGSELYSKYNDIKLLIDGELQDDDMHLLMPSRVPGFALRKKQWTLFDVQSFKDKEQDIDPKALD